MVSDELITWMKNARSKGYSDDQLKQYLASKGYTTESINEALLSLDEESVGASLPSTSETSTSMNSSSQASSTDSYVSSSSSNGYKPKKKMNVKAIMYLILIPLCAIGLYFFMLAPTPTVCSTDISCDDGQSNTYDMCVNPDTEQASCINALILESKNTNAILEVGDAISFTSASREKVLRVDKIGATGIQVSVFPPKKVVLLRSLQTSVIDVDNNNLPDIDVTLTELSQSDAAMDMYVYP